jgi:hypothetical protein
VAEPAAKAIVTGAPGTTGAGCVTTGGVGGGGVGTVTAGTPPMDGTCGGAAGIGGMGAEASAVPAAGVAGDGPGAGNDVAATAPTGARRGAGGGGAEAAASDALMPESAEGALAGGAGGAALAGGAAGSGARELVYSAFARSAINALAIRPRVAASIVTGLVGTVPSEGYGAFTFGGGGRCWAMLPPSSWCHQVAGANSPFWEQPATRPIAAQDKTARDRLHTRGS